MATSTQWVQGTRPRTLPAAVSPVLVGTGAAAAAGSVHIGRALLALAVAVALQIGVNFANDYSDGVRGTDDDRVGPFRLVGSGAVRAATVKAAAWVSFGVAALCGLVLVVLTAEWWLLAVGAAAVAAAWYYTGGSRPYGYRGMGELSVFVFFGLVAVGGTTFVQTGQISASSVLAGAAVGSSACALLLVNNIRDAPKDAGAGKRTLAVFLGQQRSRLLYAGLMTAPFVLALPMIVTADPWVALALLAIPMTARVTVPVLRGDEGPALIPALQGTSFTGLLFASLLTVGLFLS
ncbi:1,4-dihydroxy-2-naphthoate polyprenyltransferase [Phytoactinopolyspora alkaliphila]|uniref:1,4-dihydroxy-2-naphthoate octaprenyltransferase n=1 Tax=Phytoactinopolyspora alkaliphila TaxID=1783498 RepID=A0A6N9YHV6_9ACTN|nr:1,4-dihydroxy-2-naphthoate polyprenyltransferase [Phytoactinopolyspora alkaliphila]NED94532.1 1,4-dihydroxy-2-naphthoate polyprenyltransferase [Phytoactinopolyspora alkaliphila]